MSRDFFDPTPEQQNVVLINSATLHEAERLIESCEHCNPGGAEIPFDVILDRVTESDPQGDGLYSGEAGTVSGGARREPRKDAHRTKLNFYGRVYTLTNVEPSG